MSSKAGIRYAALTAAWIAVFCASPAQAQVAPPGGAIDDRYRSSSGQVLPEVNIDDALLTGSNDLLLLRPTELFSPHGSLTTSTTSNAFLSPEDARSATFVIGEAGLQAATRIAELVDVFADISLVAARYQTYGELDYSAVAGALGARTRWQWLALSFVYQPSAIYNRSFSVHQLTQHQLAFSAAAPMQIEGWVVEPSIGFQRVWADPSDYTNWAASTQIVASHAVPGLKDVLAFVAAGYERREYDAYFPDLLGVDRKDDRGHGSIGLQWQFKPNAAIVVDYTYQQNWSTSDVNGFRASNGSIGLSLRGRF